MAGIIVSFLIGLVFGAITMSVAVVAHDPDDPEEWR